MSATDPDDFEDQLASAEEHINELTVELGEAIAYRDALLAQRKGHP